MAARRVVELPAALQSANSRTISWATKWATDGLQICIVIITIIGVMSHCAKTACSNGQTYYRASVIIIIIVVIIVILIIILLLIMYYALTEQVSCKLPNNEHTYVHNTVLCGSPCPFGSSYVVSLSPSQLAVEPSPLRRDALPVSRDLRDRRCLEAPCRPKKEE